MNNEETQEKLKCEGCGKEFVENDLRKCEDNTYYCDDCFEGFYCEDCEETYSSGDDACSVEGGNRIVCEGCYSDIYYSCSNCGDSRHSDNMYSCGDCESEDYCESCWNEYEHHCNDSSDERSVDTTHIRGDKEGKTIKIDRLVGVEIEAENGNRDDLFESLHSQCGITDDGSLDESGVEVQTPPASLDKLEDIITGTTKAMKDASFEISERCGLHVHVDMHDVRYDYSKITALYKSVYAVENILYAMLQSSRKNNSYCYPLRKKWKISDVNLKMTENQFLEKWYEEKSISEIQRFKTSHSPRNRYMGLNLHSIVYRGTVEFRHHTGSLNNDKIINWINLLLHIVDYSINKYDSKRIHEMEKIKTNKALIKAFFKEFNIPQELQEYVMARIKRNNPDFLLPKKSVAIEQAYKVTMTVTPQGTLQVSGGGGGAGY